MNDNAPKYASLFARLREEAFEEGGGNFVSNLETREHGRASVPADDRTQNQVRAYDEGWSDQERGTVDDLRAMRCKYYAAGVRAAHYSESCQG